MQMKYLSLALAAALATTLTACGGSDNKSNYNKDTLTPVTKPDTGNTGGTTDGGNTDGTTDGGNTNTDGGNTNTDGTNDQTEEGGDNNSDSDNESGDGTEAPGPDPKNNPGNAAYHGKATTQVSTVGQQYRRGNTANFDRPKNESLPGNSTVFSWQKLDNQEMTNIVNGRETVELKASPLSYRRFTGQNTMEADPNVQERLSLQKVNGDGHGKIIESDGAKTVEQLYAKTAVLNSTNYKPQDRLTGENAASFLGAGHVFYKDGEINASLNPGSTERDPTARPSNNNLQGYFADTSNNLHRKNQNNGLVKIDTSAINHKILGQEDQVTADLPNGDVQRIIFHGQNSPTRIFGRYYNQTERDADNEANSWVFFADQVYKLNSAKNNADTNTTYQKVGNVGSAGSQIGKNSELAIFNYDSLDPAASSRGGAGEFGLAAKAIKLNHVQYGRVTSNINALDDAAVKAIMEQSIDKQAFFHAPYRNKFNLNKGENAKTTPNNTVDTYYYRGVADGTSLEEMTKLPQSGEYVYNGHAISYGLDNTYHGKRAVGGTNSFAFGSNQVGLGNFVTAKYDLGTKKVDGFIYNAWLSDIKKGDVEPDKLVFFQGDVVGNSIVNGVAKLGYTPTDPNVPVDGAFKGSFYGSKAEEMGGAVNSVKEGYGTAKWGAVFGAQRRAVSDGNANQID